MTDTDIRRWLRLQTASDVGHVDIATVQSGSLPAIGGLARTCPENHVLVIVDAVTDDVLVAIGRAVADHPTCYGQIQG
ncbi:four-carbon acid sugar kinase family protein [Sinorhizobium psoraleae]|uniref:Four-carbon acid sugar kinase N-terminal domain-containing protein n=1 Tax=Sinorhizobium psoraleae TaxID=520838 RepID=A0ABT4KAG3_9HYPH|nr:hypothetical protein [Sinorhizobium psoraleae]